MAPSNTVETARGTAWTLAPEAHDVLGKTLKFLAIDAVQKADSGHPGMPMGMATAAGLLWAEFLTIDPPEPGWADRDRFVLSAGHGSMLLYGLLHLSGHHLPMSELEQFRQLHSKTPGHPEHGVTPGVETTTGPLGQGFANAVGMAMTEVHLAARYNRDGHRIIDHYTYGICSDGDLQEGVCAEAASLAGHLGLGKLVLLYDDNGITIEGKTDLAYTDDVPLRFAGYHWHVLTVDGHDVNALRDAIRAATAETRRPSLICCKTHIGHGSPNKQDTAGSHGSPLGAAEVKLTKQALGWPEAPTFLVPDGARAAFDGLRTRGHAAHADWTSRMQAYRDAHPALAAELERALAGTLPGDLEASLPAFDDTPIATRSASGKVINALKARLPTLWGGSADLAGSTKTLMSGEESFSHAEPGGRNLHFGIREHAMAAIMNGMALHGGVIPYGATFLTFSDYMRGGLRLAALMRQRVIHVLTHDSIFLGEDGPTHQSVEHALVLRAIPDMVVLRPADARETAWAWSLALHRAHGPTCLLLSRQDLPGIPGSGEGLLRGGYVVRDFGRNERDARQAVLIGSGSELHLCLQAADLLAARGIGVRVVSMPSIEVFQSQSPDYQASVLPPTPLVRVSIEAGRTGCWTPLVGPFGVTLGIDRFGESAPAEVLAEHFGFTAQHVADATENAVVALPEKIRAWREVLGA